MDHAILATPAPDFTKQDSTLTVNGSRANFGGQNKGVRTAMTTFLYLILVLDGLFMAVVVLLQAGKGGGLAAVGGGSAMTEGILAGRQATSILTRSTWTSGTIFLATSLALSIISQRNALPTSVIDVAPPAAAPAPILGIDGPQPASEGVDPGVLGADGDEEATGDGSADGSNDTSGTANDAGNAGTANDAGNAGTGGSAGAEAGADGLDESG